jgi:hypothetical protein
MEPRSIGNRLDVSVRRKVGIGPGDCRKLSTMQTRDRLWEHKIGIEIGVIRAATVSRPPARVQGKLHKVG